MAKFALFVIVAACILLRNSVVGEKLAKRQSCNTADLPSACRPILASGVFGAAFADSTNFVNNYCGDMCGQPLYNYLKNCDAGSNNTTMFDFFCSSNAAREQCLQQTLTAQDSLLDACANPFQGTTCNATCESALATANESLGCCLFSYYAVTGGLSGANLIFDFCGEDLKMLCVGGVSGQTLQFPTPAVNPECEEFVDDVDESCRYLLGDDPTILAISDLDGFCGEKCGPEIYQFNRNCDEQTGGNASVFSDVLCARNNEDKQCNEYLNNFHALGFEACNGIGVTCPAECSTALKQGQATFGCCLPSLLQLFSGVDISKYSAILSTLCKVDIDSNCLGAFSGKPAPPPAIEPTEKPTSARCGSLRNAIPATCQDVSTIDTIFFLAYSNHSAFHDRFCKGNCASPVYEYINECVNSTEAVYIDFLCSQTPSGTQCVNILSDESLDTVLEGVCRDATDKQCSRDCQVSVEGFAKTYGCCLFTYSALDTNVTHANGLYAQCGADNPGLCTGGISNAAINAPEGEVENAAVGTIFRPTLLLISCLAFTITM